jgi:hypothetical protein
MRTSRAQGRDDRTTIKLALILLLTNATELKMARYQIRTHENQVIEDVIQIMAAKTWGILIAWEVFRKEPTEKDYSDFHQSIFLRMVPFVRSYKLCGFSNICLDETRGTSWAPPSHDLDPQPRDLIYHLFPPKGSEEFLDGLSKSGFESISNLIKPEMLEQVQSILKTAFRAILGEHLYFNPLCGKTELCVYSSSSPQKVWGRTWN